MSETDSSSATVAEYRTYSTVFGPVTVKVPQSVDIRETDTAELVAEDCVTGRSR